MTRFARVRDLQSGLDRSSPDSLDAAVERVTDAVRSAGERGVLLVNLGGPGQGDARRQRPIPLSGDDPGTDTGGRPDVEIRCSDGTFWRMIDGSYSPVEAYREGKLRVRGDEPLAKRVLRHLAGPDGSVDCM